MILELYLTIMLQHQFMSFYKICLFIIVFIMFHQLNFAQQIIMSSTNKMNQNTTLSTPIYFKSNNQCIDIQSGMAILNSNNKTGVFETNCIINHQFNALNMVLLPNVVNSTAFLKFKNKPDQTSVFNITIWNTEGLLIKTFYQTGIQIYDGIQLNMLSISPGGYILKAESLQNREALKFIKSN